MVFNCNCFPQNDRLFKVSPRPLQPVTYTVKVVTVHSIKWCKIDMLLHITNRKYHMAYRFMPFPVSLDVVKGHLPVAGLIKCNSTNNCATFCMVSTDMALRASLGDG